MHAFPAVSKVRCMSDLQEEDEPDSQLQYEEYNVEADIASDGCSTVDDDEEEITDDFDDTQCLELIEELMSSDEPESPAKRDPEEDSMDVQNGMQLETTGTCILYIMIKYSIYKFIYCFSVNCNNREWKGFKIVGDNLDKNFRCTFQRIDYQTRSFHFFHAYAVLDRVNLSGTSDIPQPGLIDFTKVIPTRAEVIELNQILSIFITRCVMYAWTN